MRQAALEPAIKRSRSSFGAERRAEALGSISRRNVLAAVDFADPASPVSASKPIGACGAQRAQEPAHDELEIVLAAEVQKPLQL